MYVWTLLSIYMSKMSGRDHENLTTNFNCIYCQNFSMKTEFILDFLFFYLFILITLVCLHNTHVLNYTRNINKKIAYQTPENSLKFIFKIVTKHRKIR